MFCTMLAIIQSKYIKFKVVAGCLDNREREIYQTSDEIDTYKKGGEEDKRR